MHYTPIILSGLLILGVTAVDAQAILTTYYVIPPANGCDGTWAFGPYSDLWAEDGCTGPHMYLFDPATCIDGSQFGQPVPLNVVNDTIIMSLCSQPCDFLFYSAEGLCFVCYCGPLIPTSLQEESSAVPLILGPNPLPWDRPLLVLDPGNDRPYHVQIFDRAGRTVFSKADLAGRAELDMHGIAPGSYLVATRSTDGLLAIHRIAIQ